MHYRCTSCNKACDVIKREQRTHEAVAGPMPPGVTIRLSKCCGADVSVSMGAGDFFTGSLYL